MCVDNDSCKCQHNSAQQTISIAIILNFVKIKQRKKYYMHMQKVYFLHSFAHKKLMFLIK